MNDGSDLAIIGGSGKLPMIIKNSYKKAIFITFDNSKNALENWVINCEFEKILKHKNVIFSNGVDFVYEFFNFERKINSNLISRSVQFLVKNPNLNKLFTKIADKGTLI